MSNAYYDQQLRAWVCDCAGSMTPIPLRGIPNAFRFKCPYCNTVYSAQSLVVGQKTPGQHLSALPPPPTPQAPPARVFINTLGRGAECLPCNSYLSGAKGSGAYVCSNCNSHWNPQDVDNAKHGDVVYAFSWPTAPKQAAPTKIDPLARFPWHGPSHFQYSPITGQCDTVRYDGHDFRFVNQTAFNRVDYYGCNACGSVVDNLPTAAFPLDSCATIQGRTRAPVVWTQGPPVGMPLAQPIILSVPDDFGWPAPTPPMPASKPACLDCDRELSEYLDAWYGKDDYGSHFCSPCREKRGIR